jgi:hypothetical protein
MVEKERKKDAAAKARGDDAGNLKKIRRKKKQKQPLKAK